MADEEEEQQTLIYESRKTKVVSPKDGDSSKSTMRIARFLKPCAKQINQAIPVPNTPLLSEIFPHRLQQWPSKILFRAWKQPQRRWKEWVETLAEKHGAIWNQTGICDAIMSSIYEVRCNSDLVLGLCEFWCSETNSFVFPWGESTITLEDLMVLGGYPVLGEPVTSPLDEELVKIERELEKQRSQMLKSKAKKADHSSWIKHFMVEQNEFEHVGFLSLWLSRFVFPSIAEETIGKHVFAIAIHLSRGTPMALGPAVLGSLYRDLRLLKQQTVDSMESIVVKGPFQLVQLWAFEHFPLMGPNSPNSLLPGEPRVARWHKLSLKINLPLVRSALQLPENFKWRPYASNLENWRHPVYYEETEQWLSADSSLELELRSFFKCLQASELIGVDCKEKYLPHRVAMQFGMDQDLPADPCGLNFIGEHVGFFVPPRSFQPGVSERYIKWWKDMMLTRNGAIKHVLVEKRYAKISKDLLPLEANRNGEDCHGSVASGNQVNPMSLSQPSTKSSSEGSLSSIIPEFPSKGKMQRFVEIEEEDWPTMNPKISSSVQAKKIKGSCQVSIASKIPKGGSKLPQVSTKSNKEHIHESVTPAIPSGINEGISYDSSDEDHIPLSMRLKHNYSVSKSSSSSHQTFSHYQSQSVASSTSKVANCNSRKRKLGTTTKGGEVTTKRTSGVAEEVEVKAGKHKSTNGTNGTAREVKTEVGCVNGLIDIDEPIEMKQYSKEGRESPKGVAEVGKQRKAGESIGDPIDLDHYKDITTSRFQKVGKDLEQRVEKLEKLLGLNPD
ncbi:hypothetical protein ACSBR1_028851 [Camellia fascicularis]